MKVHGITPNRAIALYHLRHSDINQAFGRLLNVRGDRCALGLIGHAFDVNCDIQGSDQPYLEIASKIDMPDATDWSSIYILNDERRSFRQIADLLERYFEDPVDESFYSWLYRNKVWP